MSGESSGRPDGHGGCVLQVTADRELGEQVTDRLAEYDDTIAHVTATSVDAGLDRFRRGDVTAVVSGHEDGIDGLAFLEAVRERDPTVPFVLVPDDGSETLAGRALAAGVSAYVPRADGTDVLVDRLVDALETGPLSGQRQTLEEREAVLRRTYEIISDRDRPFEAKVDALLRTAQEVIGTDYATLSRVRGEDYVFEVVQAPDDSIEAGDVVPLAATNCERTVVTEETLVLADIEREAPDLTEKAGFAEWGIACYLGAPVVVDDEVYGTFCFYDDAPRTEPFSDWEVTLVDLLSRWISYELERQRATERLAAQNERLDQFASIVSHDLRNPLQVARSNLEMAQTEDESELLDAVESAHDRMDLLIDDLLTLAREGATVDEVEPVDIESVASDAWANVSTPEATLRIEGSRTIEADESRLTQVFENLFRNSIQHGGEDVTVRVGDLPNGFYVEDDGPGIPEADREDVFENGYTTGEDGTGLGLFIVDRIADAHDWTVTATESGGESSGVPASEANGDSAAGHSESAGARFEFVYR